MKKSATVLTLLVLTLALWAGSAFAYDINDEYVGSNNHGYGDVIGSWDEFNIFGADVSLSGSTLDINIYTNFAGLGDDRLFWYLTKTSNSTVNSTFMGIGYGDLFLSDSWLPNGTSPSYPEDDNSNGTIWTYGFALDDPLNDRWSSGGSGTLYRLESGNNNADALLADDFISGGTYRDGQEVAVDPSSTGVTLLTGNTGTWTIDETNGLINFSINISGTTLLSSSNEIALHWGMTCANDVIEGSTSVTEPATMLLFGVGLIGMVGFGRKKLLKR